MYMDILEQEVEALSAEVTRLRLMVHRITQVMEAPPPRRHSHVDPLRDAPSPSPSDDNAHANLQSTVDSYKQILPLIQLLLEQQQHAKEVSARRSTTTTTSSSSGSKNKSKNRRRKKEKQKRTEHRRRHHDHRSPSSTSASACSSHTASQSGSATSHTRTSSSSSSDEQPPQTTHREKKKAKANALPASAQEAQRPATTVASPARRRQSIVSIQETPTWGEQRVHVPTPMAKSGSIVDRLRAQRGLASRDDNDSNKDGSDTSTESSNVMPMLNSQARSAATSPSASAKAAVPTRSAHPEPSLSVSPHLQSGHSLTSSKLLDAPVAAEVAQRSSTKLPVDSVHSSSIPAEDMGCYAFSPVPSALDAVHEVSDLPAESNAQRARLSMNSIEYSEQGRYSYSAMGSLANSPAVSHMPDDAGRNARTGTSTAASAALEVLNTATSHKQLPRPTSIISRMRDMSSSSSSSSDSSNGDEKDMARTSAVLATSAVAHPFGSSIVLGTRQPISARTPSSSGPPSVLPTPGRIGGAAVGAAALVTRNTGGGGGGGGVAAAEARTNLLVTLRSMKHSSSSGSDTSSSSDSAAAAAAAFQRKQARQAQREDHRESSFHNYSEAASSPPVSSVSAPLQKPRQQQRHCPSQQQQQDSFATVSQDACSFAAYSALRSPHSSPQTGIIENEASGDASRAVSHSVSRLQTARSDSHGASSGGHLGSLESGGYYYGYEFGLGSPSQQSVASNAGGEHRTASSSPGYDY